MPWVVKKGKKVVGSCFLWAGALMLLKQHPDCSLTWQRSLETKKPR